MLPARAWCDLLDTPAFGIRNIGGPGWSLLFSLRGVGGTDSIPHGRVGAEIVCDDTLVQYAAYCALVFFFLVEKDEGGIIRFRLFWRGWRFTHFFPRSVFCFPLPSMLRCALGVGLERIVFGDSAN